MAAPVINAHVAVANLDHTAAPAFEQVDDGDAAVDVLALPPAAAPVAPATPTLAAQNGGVAQPPSPPLIGDADIVAGVGDLFGGAVDVVDDNNAHQVVDALPAAPAAAQASDAVGGGAVLATPPPPPPLAAGNGVLSPDSTLFAAFADVAKDIAAAQAGDAGSGGAALAAPSHVALATPDTPPLAGAVGSGKAGSALAATATPPLVVVAGAVGSGKAGSAAKGGRFFGKKSTTVKAGSALAATATPPPPPPLVVVAGAVGSGKAGSAAKGGRLFGKQPAASTTAATSRVTTHSSLSHSPYVHDQASYLPIGENTFRSLRNKRFKILKGISEIQQSGILIPTGSSFPTSFLVVYEDDSRALGEFDGTRFLATQPATQKDCDHHNALAAAAARKIEERKSDIDPRTWTDQKNSPITVEQLMSNGGTLEVKTDDKGEFISSVVTVELEPPLKLPKKKMAGKIQEYSSIKRIEITKNGNLSFTDKYGRITTLNDYGKEAEKILRERFPREEKHESAVQTVAASRTAPTVAAPRKALDGVGAGVGTFGEKRPAVVSFSASKGGTIAVPKEKLLHFRTQLPRGFKHSTGITSSQDASYCLSYTDGSRELFNAKHESIAKGNEINKSELRAVEAQIELQLQAQEAISLCSNLTLRQVAASYLETQIVERDGERGFKFSLPRERGLKAPASISITNDGKIEMTGAKEALAASREIKRWPDSKRKTENEEARKKLSAKINSAVEMVPVLMLTEMAPVLTARRSVVGEEAKQHEREFTRRRRRSVNEADIQDCEDESELLRLFFLGEGRNYLNNATDADKHTAGTSKSRSKSENGDRLKFTFGDAAEKAVVKIRIPVEPGKYSRSKIGTNDARDVEMITIDSTVPLAKLIEIMKAGHTSSIMGEELESRFIQRSKEIARERQGKNPLPTARERERKVDVIDREVMDALLESGVYYPGTEKEGVLIPKIKKANSTTESNLIESCESELDLLKHIGKNLFSRIKHADVDCETKDIGRIPFFKRKVQNFNFHFEVPSGPGKPREAFDFVIQTEINGEISNYELKWSPERKGALQPTFEHVAEAMNRMRDRRIPGTKDDIDSEDKIINVAALTQKLQQEGISLPTKPTSIIPLPKGFEHNPGPFSRNKPCKFCAIHENCDGARTYTLLDENGVVVASGDKIKEAETSAITSQEALQRKVRITGVAKTSEITSQAALQRTERVAERREGAAKVRVVDKDDEAVLLALAKKLLKEVAVVQVNTKSTDGAITRRGKDKKQQQPEVLYKLPISSLDKGHIAISNTGDVSLKNCTLDEALSALKLTREELSPKEKLSSRGGAVRGRGAAAIASTRVGSGAAYVVGAMDSSDGTYSSLRERSSYGGEEEKDRHGAGGIGVGRAGSDVLTRGGGSAFRFNALEDYPSSSPSPSEASKLGSQSILKTIAEMAILALPPGGTVDHLITIAESPSRAKEILGESFAQNFQKNCRLHEVYEEGAGVRRSSRVSSERGMSFSTAFSPHNYEALKKELSEVRTENLEELKQKIEGKYESRVHRTSV